MSRIRRLACPASIVCTLAGVLHACGGATTPSNTTAAAQPVPDAQPMRNHPRARVVNAALAEAGAHAAACLPPEVQQDVRVQGEFVGESGVYRIVAISGAPLTPEQDHCVRDALSAVHVPPFRAERQPAACPIALAREAGAAMAVQMMPVDGANPCAPPATAASAPPSSAPSADGNTAAASTPASDAPPPPAAGDRGALSEAYDVVQGRVQLVARCFTTQLAVDRTLRARLGMRFSIEATGHISYASTTATILAGEPQPASDFVRCAESVVRGTHFARGQAGPPVEIARSFDLAAAAAAH